MNRHRLVLSRVNLAVINTDYELTIPEGASCVRVALNDATVAWRYDTSAVAAAGSGMLVAAGQPAVFGDAGTEIKATQLHVGVSAGAGVGLFAVLSCLVPLTR
jgi:hypothetical protein